MRNYFRQMFLTAVFAVVVSSSAQAATFTVTRFDDPAPPLVSPFCVAGNCSLREAVLQANVTAGPSNSITLPSGNYALTILGTGEDAGFTGDLDILNHPLTINGANANTTIVDASALGDRAFDNPAIGTSAVVFNNLTITGGNVPMATGGAIYFNGTSGVDVLTLNNCWIENNHADAVGLAGGGGIGAQGGDVVINNSTFSGNTANGGFGGAMVGAGNNISINNSTFSENNATAGGGVAGLASTVTIRSSTIFNNSATNDAGGIFAVDFGGAANFNLENTILTGNTAGVGSADCSRTGTSVVTSAGYNMFGDVANCTIAGPNPGDQLNVVNPKLLPLLNFGGQTPTLLLKSDSSAIDNGSPGVCPGTSGNLTTDQRGQTRPVGANCDIGAVELGTADLTLDKTVDASPVNVGSTITYTVVVKNNGPDIDFNVAVTDTLPAGGAVTFVSATADNGGVCTQAAGVVICQLGQMNNGDTVTVTIQVTAATTGTVTNTATAVGTEEDATPATDSVDVTINAGGGGCSMALASSSSGSAMLLISIAVGSIAAVRRRK